MEFCVKILKKFFGFFGPSTSLSYLLRGVALVLVLLHLVILLVVDGRTHCGGGGAVGQRASPDQLDGGRRLPAGHSTARVQLRRLAEGH